MGFARAMNYPDMNVGLDQSFQSLANPVPIFAQENDASTLNLALYQALSSDGQVVQAGIPAIRVIPPTHRQAPAQVHSPALHRCNWPGCNKRFKRPSDLLRHRNAVHFNIQGHLCPIAGCPKARGNGYSRADKVTEHLWKKHADLGYTKA